MSRLKYITRYTMLFYFMVILLQVYRSNAQSQHSLIEYTTENGLSLNSVNDLLFDKQGFLWISTADGLQRFNGYKFQTLKHDPFDNKSIGENSVSEVYEDNNGNLWITHRTGICFKPKGKNEFIDLSSKILSSDARRPLICAYETDSSVWIINYPTAIHEINKMTLNVKKIFSLPQAFEKNPAYFISRGKTKGETLWFTTGTTKYGDLCNVTKNGLIQFSNSEKIRIHFLIPQEGDSLVIVADKMLYKALSKDPYKPVKILNSSLDTKDFENVYGAIPRKIANHQYLLPGVNKIWVYDGNNETLSVFPRQEYFSGNMIRYFNTATADDHQNSWIGYNGIGGIKVISLQKFNLFNRPDKNALTYTLVGDDEQGKIFAGIYYGDIEVYNREGQFLNKIKLPESHKRFGSPRAMAMMDSTTLIVKSTLHELYAVDTRKGTVEVISHLLPRTDSVFRVFETGIQTIKKNEVWVSYNNSILSIHKDKKGFISDIICTIPGKEAITTFYCNTSGQLWIGTTDGAWLFDKNNFTKVPLPVTYVKHINQHPDGSIWIATTFGLYILKNNVLIKTLNTKEGLPNSFIYSILFDKGGNGWISSNKGLVKISPIANSADTAFSITSYSAREGLQGDEFNTKGYYKASDGTLYFAGVNGINFFKPGELVSKSGPSQTMLTEIEVNNQPYRPDLQAEFISTINLPHRQNNLRLSFSNMDFTVPEKNQYKFWLKGFQNDWTLPQTNNTVQYILPPAEYELQVLSANYEGVWSNEPLIIDINILPPWYQTSWARIIFLFFALGSVAVIFYFVSKNKYQKKLRRLQMEQEMQKEKERLSRDLHDNLGSQITWLSNNITQLDNAQRQQQPVEQKMNRLKEGTGELMQTLRETIWILNKDKISAIDFFDKLVSHAARYLEADPAIRLQTEEYISPRIQLNSGQALQLFRISQEAVTNACKHSEASQITIAASSSENKFGVSISDNGKGFDLTNDELEGHYGLQNMKQRAEESDLQLTIESSPGKGTTITVSVLP